MKHKLFDYVQMSTIKTNIIKHTCSYLEKHPNIESLILGVSGGADSALVAMLANDVCRIMNTRQYKYTKIKLIGRSLPIMTNKEDEIERANRIGTLLCNNFDTVDLEAMYVKTATSCGFENSPIDESQFSASIRHGNIKARIRMIYLYNLAQLNKGMVLSTDNYTEYLLGFWTLHGDVGDFGMIQSLWKTEVNVLLEHYHDQFEHNERENIGKVLLECRKAVPTDGLGITESDLDQFGGIHSYEEVDKTFIEKLNNGYSRFIQQRAIPEVLSMYERTKYKRHNPFNIPREEILEI